MDDKLAGGSLIALALFLSTFIEFVVERFFGGFKLFKGKPMVFIAAATGIILCIALNIDILKLVGFDGEYISWIGQVISGLIIGSGSNAIHVLINPSNSGSDSNGGE